MSDPYGQPPYGQPGYQQYGPQQYGYGAPRTAQEAIIALVLAVAGFVVCPVVPSVVALVYAGRAEQAIAASGGALTGAGLVTVARVLAWVELAFAAVGLLVLFLVIGLALHG